MKVIIIENGESVEEALKKYLEEHGNKPAEAPAQPEPDELETIRGLMDDLDQMNVSFDRIIRTREWIHLMRDIPETEEHKQVFINTAETVKEMFERLRVIGKVVGGICDTCQNDYKQEVRDLVDSFECTQARLAPVHELTCCKMVLLGLWECTPPEKDPSHEDCSACNGCCGCCGSFECDFRE